MFLVRLNQQRLAAHLAEKSMTRAAFARSAGLSEQTMYRVEARGSQPSAQVVGALIAATGIAFDELFVVEESS